MTRQSNLDNHSNQHNPNNEAYWESRGIEMGPVDQVGQVGSVDKGGRKGKAED